MSIKIVSIPTKLSVAFLGLETMGYSMAGHLARQGHAVIVYNPTERAALEWVNEHQAINDRVKRAPMPIDAAWKAKVVFACFANEDELRCAVLGKSGAFAGMKPGTIFINHTTVREDVAQELAAEAQARALKYMNAPIMSGGEKEAKMGALSIVGVGAQNVYDFAHPLVSTYAKTFVSSVFDW